MDEREIIRPDVGAYEGIRTSTGDPLSPSGIAKLISTYRGAEMLGIAGVVGLYQALMAPVANVIVHIVGIVSILMVVVTGMLVTGRRHASTKAGTGETQADP